MADSYLLGSHQPTVENATCKPTVSELAKDEIDTRFRRNQPKKSIASSSGPDCLHDNHTNLSQEGRMT